jgi:hypothetical protein
VIISGLIPNDIFRDGENRKKLRRDDDPTESKSQASVTEALQFKYEVQGECEG